MASMNKSPKKRFGLGDIIIFGIILIAIIFIFAGSCGGNKATTIETKEEFYGYFFDNAEYRVIFIRPGGSHAGGRNCNRLIENFLVGIQRMSGDIKSDKLFFQPKFFSLRPVLRHCKDKLRKFFFL